MSKQKDGVPINSLAEWAAFDALPKPIRHVVAHAPYEYKCSGFLNAFKCHIAQGGDVRSFRAEVVRSICDQMQKLARKTYGADHPDAVHHRLEKARGHA